jgi:hypothetical protein
MKSAIILVLALLIGCATEPAIKPASGELHIISHKCDQWGVASITVLATAETIATMKWSNEAICGVPS